ncbi:Retrovirus-related Pol polyprotein from transposon 17.6 [Exaiptasia diaphana]|nr:Retrovirus-related Pol polyprotein from transposon 17.6 [Exaiptasia diaphana]
MVGFSARFIPDFVTTAKLLRKIARKDSAFIWEADQQRAFDKSKEDLASAPVLTFFDRHAHTRVIADASPVGLGVVLTQEQDGETRAVCYASRSLSSVERRYSQTENEALALVWVCKKFNIYLLGLESFDLVTDHEPLKAIYSNTSKPSARIQRWVLRLQPFNFKSMMFQQHSTLRKASAEDKELQAVRACLVSGHWNSAPKEYVVGRNDIGKVILRGNRIVITKSLRKRVTDMAHEGHQGIVKTGSDPKSTPHSTTGKSPSQLLYNRSLCKLPNEIKLEEEDKDNHDIRDRDAEKKQAIADYADKRNRPLQIDELKEGNLVLLEKRKDNKLTPSYEEDP